MASQSSSSSTCFQLILSFLILFSIIITPSKAKTSTTTSFRPKALVLGVKKDSSTLQYITTIKQGTPRLSIKLGVDLGAEISWLACDEYVSATYKPIHCGSAQCSLVDTTCLSCYPPTMTPGCYNSTCYVDVYNPFIEWGNTESQLSQDTVSIKSTDGSNPRRRVSVHDFVFSCMHVYLLQGMAIGVRGMVGLGRNEVGLPYQFSNAFGLKRKFAICLSPSTTSNGVIMFGDGPYNFLPNKVDISKFLTYTPLIKNPIRSDAYAVGKMYSEYFIQVKSIKINSKVVPLNTSLLSIDKYGYGGTRISTLYPYTRLVTSIYKVFVDEFVKAIGNKVPRVAAVEPFGACFNSSRIEAMPVIDLVLQRNNVYWRIFGSNSVVQVAEDVLCLGFVDAGEFESSSIVIGGYQLEDNLLQFDLDSNRLGFSSSLLFKQTSCSNFNLTSI